jgi:hypothetical protein
VGNGNPEEKNNPVGALIIFIFFALGLFILAFYPLKKMAEVNYSQTLSTEANIGFNEILRMGKQDKEHEDLLAQIRKDLFIPECLEVKIFIGPYNQITGEGQLIYSTRPFVLALMLDEFFYQNLTSEEKIALIGHELGHLTNDIVLLTYNNADTIIGFQIEADTYATKYASPEAMMSVLNKANDRHGNYPSRQYYLRIKNLERIRDLKQGH